MLYLATLITKEFENKTSSWLYNDINLFWLNVLNNVIADLIIQVTTSLIAVCRKSINKKAIQIIFYLVFIFNHITNKFFPNFKDIMHIKKKLFLNLKF